MSSTNSKKQFVQFKDMVLDENTWRKFERSIARRERPRLIRNKTIIPNMDGVQMFPQMFSKGENGEWKAKLGYSG